MGSVLKELTIALTYFMAMAGASFSFGWAVMGWYIQAGGL